ncbi:hypothetical protein D3C87_1691730 [compost metagenome]
MAFEDFFHRDLADARLHVQRRHRLAHVQGALGFKVAVVQVAAQVLQRQQAAHAVGLEYSVVDRQFVEGQLAEGQVGVHIEFAQAFHRQ